MFPFFIREQDPLKQGLKRLVFAFLWSCINDSRARSTKTRIETIFRIVDSLLFYHIREQDPLKQGLKRLGTPLISESKKIREQDPLKQGLKPV